LCAAFIGIAIMLLPFFLIAIITGQIFPRRNGRWIAPAPARDLGPGLEPARPSWPQLLDAPSVTAGGLTQTTKSRTQNNYDRKY
jgi:hypothetical protein